MGAYFRLRSDLRKSQEMKDDPGLFLPRVVSPRLHPQDIASYRDSLQQVVFPVWSSRTPFAPKEARLHDMVRTGFHTID